MAMISQLLSLAMTVLVPHLLGVVQV